MGGLSGWAYLIRGRVVLSCRPVIWRDARVEDCDGPRHIALPPRTMRLKKRMGHVFFNLRTKKGHLQK